MEPEDTGLLFEQASEAAMMGNAEAARVILKRLLAEDPQNVEAWLLFSDVAETPEQAAECLDSILDIEPGHGIAESRLFLYRAALQPPPQPEPEPEPEPVPVQQPSPPPQEIPKLQAPPEILPEIDFEEPDKPARRLPKLLGRAPRFLIALVALSVICLCPTLVVGGLHYSGLIDIPIFPDLSRPADQPIAQETSLPTSTPIPAEVVYQGSPESYLPVQAELPEGYTVLEPNSGPFGYQDNPGSVVVFYNPDKALTGSAYIVKYKLVVFSSTLAAETYFIELAAAPVTEFVSSAGLELGVQEFSAPPEFDQVVYQVGRIPADEASETPAQPVHVLIFISDNITGYVMVTGVEVGGEGTEDILSAELQSFISLVVGKIQ